MRQDFNVLRALLPLLSSQPWTLPTIVFLGLLSSGLEGVGLYLFVPLLAMLEDSANRYGDFPSYVGAALDLIPESAHLPGLVALVVLSVILKNAVAFWNSANFATVDARTGHWIRCELFTAILKASPGYIDTQSSGRIANALLGETWRVTRALSAFYIIIVDACAIVIFTGVLLFISWQATLLVTPVLILIVGILLLVTKRVHMIGEAAVEANAVYSHRAWEGVTGFRTICVFGQGPFEESRLNTASNEIRRLFLDLQLLTNLIPLTFEVLVAAAVGVWIVVLAWSGVGIPTMAVFLVILYRMQPRVRSILVSRTTLLESGSAVREIEAVKRECLNSQLPSGGRPLRILERGVSFSNVTARYPGSGVAAVVDVDLFIPRNSTTAIVGPSGSGKSTIVALLSRAMDPVTGAVSIDGIDLREFHTDDWYSRLAVVTQDIFLFDDSVFNNIRYGRLDATREEVEEVARLAHAHDFIMELPLGYDTLIGDRGIRLSGGQRQRIAFARALVRRPDLLIMDEATNALDSHSEELIQISLEKIGKTMTIVTVAHRLSTVRDADQIVVLDHGRAVERGTYSMLMLQDGIFAAMARLQSLDVEMQVDRSEFASRARMSGMYDHETGHQLRHSSI